MLIGELAAFGVRNLDLAEIVCAKGTPVHILVTFGPFVWFTNVQPWGQLSRRIDGYANWSAHSHHWLSNWWTLDIHIGNIVCSIDMLTWLLIVWLSWRKWYTTLWWCNHLRLTHLRILDRTWVFDIRIILLVGLTGSWFPSHFDLYFFWIGRHLFF